MKVLVFGRSGQLARELARNPWPAGTSLAWIGRGDGDITDSHAVAEMFSAHRPDLVVNAAAYTAVDNAESDAEAAYALNADAPSHVAALCRASGGVPLLHVSTDYVFDGTKPGLYAEDDPVAPQGVYGASKLAGEQAVRETLPQHVILRTAWVVSPFGHNFVKTMIRLAGERDALRVVDDQTGCPTGAGDLARALIAIATQINKGRADAFGTYHYCGADVTSWCGFARGIMDELVRCGRRAVPVEAIGTADYPTPARRPANSALDCARVSRVFGVRTRPWRAMLAELMDELLETTP